jgi:hypothetical protein
MAMYSISASIVAIPTFTDVDTTGIFTQTITSTGTRGHAITRTATELITTETRVSTTILSTLTPEAANATTSGTVETVTHGPAGALIGGIVAGVLLVLLGLIFGFYLWRRQARKKMGRRKSFWRIEEGVAPPSESSNMSQTAGVRQTTQASSSLTVPYPILNASSSSIPQKVRIDHAAELESELEAARIALQETQNASSNIASDHQSENEQTWKDQVNVLQNEVDRLRTALAVAASAPPPAYQGNRESIVTQLLVKS